MSHPPFCFFLGDSKKNHIFRCPKIGRETAGRLATLSACCGFTPSGFLDLGLFSSQVWVFPSPIRLGFRQGFRGENGEGPQRFTLGPNSLDERNPGIPSLMPSLLVKVFFSGRGVFFSKVCCNQP